MSSAAREHLGAVSREYARVTLEYKAVRRAAAAAEAEHRSKRAQAVVRFQATGEAKSHAEAVAKAEADETIAALYLDRVIKAGDADAHFEHVRQLKEQVITGRTYVVDERTSDEFHARGYTGAA